MARRFVFTLLLASLSVQGVALSAEQFPYQAVVVGEKVDVRCGPGSQFYVTSVAKENDQVTVHRHDHGGWYMISPPQGSFSWIDASLVTTTGSNRGTVHITPGSGLPNRAVVRIGSQTSDEYSFSGRELSHGDEIAILGEKTFPGGLKMYKITPPAQEFRWIKGEFLVPMSRQIQQQLAVDPYQVPAEHRARQAMLMPAQSIEPAAETKIAAPVLPSPATQTAEAAPEDRRQSSTTLMAPEATASPELVTPPSASKNQQDFAKLEKLDKAYAAMMARDPVEWDLAAIRQGLEELQSNGTPHVAYLAQQRLEAVTKRQEISQHYRNFVQVSAETSRRDAQLLAQRADLQVASEPLEAPTAFQPAMETPTTAGDNAVPLVTIGHQEPGSAAPAGVTPQLNGAGILHRMQAPPGFPNYILVAPDGRMLAYVEPGAGVSLEEWVGKPTGLIGRRGREENYGADLIRVQKVVPVQLTR